ELLEPECFLFRRRGELFERLRARGQQHGPVAGEVADDRRHGSDAEREDRGEGKPADGAEKERVEAEAEDEQERHEREHDEPCLAPVRGLLFVEVHLRDRSTTGTSRSFASLISNSSAGLKPSIVAKIAVGNTCCAVLNLVAMSL